MLVRESMHLVLVSLAVLTFSLQVIGSADTTDTTYNVAEEEARPYVNAKFYQTSLDQWNNNVADETKYILSTRATQYCKSDPQKKCGMSSSSIQPSDRNFTSNHVLVKPDYPQQDRRYLNVPMAMKLPENSGKDETYLNKPALKEIMKMSADDIKSRTGSQLLYIDDDITRLPPDHNLNAIIISIACVILIVLIIVAIVVRIKLTKKEHKEEAEKVAKKATKPVELLEVKKLRTDPSSSADTAAADDVKVDVKPEEEAANNAESAALLDRDSKAATVKA